MTYKAKSNIFFLLVSSFYFIVVGFGVFILMGYVKNLFWLLTSSPFSDGADAMDILSLMGVVLFPLGGFMGWAV